jgi:ATP-binding cassette subfamily B protein
MVFHHGELRESGTHNELLGIRGLYWRLYQLQYSSEKLHTSLPDGSRPEVGLETGVS